VPAPPWGVVAFRPDVRRETTAEELNEAFRAAEAGPMKGILGVSDEPLVSTDFRGDSRSSIIDAESTMVLGGTMIKVIAWYDNEWGYSCRCADLLALVAAKLPARAPSAACPRRAQAGRRAAARAPPAAGVRKQLERPRDSVTIRDVDVAGKRVFVRVDFNVPLEDAKVT